MGQEQGRSPRTTIHLSARLRDNNGWSEVTIRNVSPRGLLLHGAGLPRRGAFIELQSDRIAIVGEVRWSIGGRCGVRVRENIDVDRLLGRTPCESRGTAPKLVSARVRSVDAAARAAGSQMAARLIDALLLTGAVIVGAFLIGGMVAAFLARPFGQLAAHLP
jgi:hypothetical protein